MQSIDRIYHPYWNWEEVDKNMWGSVSNRQKYLDKTIDFMADTKKFGRFMERVASEWKYSCEHNLTNYSQNRIAWMGWAACALALEVPQDIVCQAWGKITDKQRNDANKKAKEVIALWERNFGGNKCLSLDLE